MKFEFNRPNDFREKIVIIHCGFIYIKVWGVCFADFISSFSIIPLK